jgi:hypothetical protein
MVTAQFGEGFEAPPSLERSGSEHRKYPLNAVLHISKKYCTFARRHHFSNFETRIRNLALHQHKLMEVIP